MFCFLIVSLEPLDNAKYFHFRFEPMNVKWFSHWISQPNKWLWIVDEIEKDFVNLFKTTMKCSIFIPMVLSFMWFIPKNLSLWTLNIPCRGQFANLNALHLNTLSKHRHSRFGCVFFSLHLWCMDKNDTALHQPANHMPWETIRFYSQFIFFSFILHPTVLPASLSLHLNKCIWSERVNWRGKKNRPSMIFASVHTWNQIEYAFIVSLSILNLFLFLLCFFGSFLVCNGTLNLDSHTQEMIHLILLDPGVFVRQSFSFFFSRFCSSFSSRSFFDVKYLHCLFNNRNASIHWFAFEPHHHPCVHCVYGFIVCVFWFNVYVRTALISLQ